MKHNAALRFYAASLCLGAIAIWASENFFWSAPPADFSYIHLPLVWLVYSLASACGLAAVMVTGITGWKALFLGGAIMGFMIEGAVAGTMFQAFPLQLVWTPLAWHALVSSLCIFGLCRIANRLTLSRLAAGWLAVGLFGALFAAYWPAERTQMPDWTTTGLYLVGVGFLVPLANAILDKLGPLATPTRGVLVLPLAILSLGWFYHVVTTLSPVTMALPLLLFFTMRVMLQHGSTSQAISFGFAAPLPRHFLFLVAPTTTVMLAAAIWTSLPALPTNIFVAAATGVVSVVLFAILTINRNTKRV